MTQTERRLVIQYGADDIERLADYLGRHANPDRWTGFNNLTDGEKRAWRGRALEVVAVLNGDAS